MSSIPGLSGAMEGVSDEDADGKLKRMIFIMDSMDNAELDSDGMIFVSRSQGCRHEVRLMMLIIPSR